MVSPASHVDAAADAPHVAADVWSAYCTPRATEALAIEHRLDGLARQLLWIRYRVNSSGRIQIESKDRIRAVEGSSPDLADALALTFAGYMEREAPGLWVIY